MILEDKQLDTNWAKLLSDPNSKISLEVQATFKIYLNYKKNHPAYY